MQINPKWLRRSQLLGNIFCLGIIVVVITFCIYYLLHSRQQLLNDYLKDGHCFYRIQRFEQEFFIDKTKSIGNVLAAIAIPTVLVFAYFASHLRFISLFVFLKNYFKQQQKSLPYLMVLLCLCIGLSFYGHYYNAMCTDEAFSAHNFADESVFRLLSYYPIPNNHIFFNLLNHFAAKITGNSFVSGRILSSVFYTLLILGNYFLFHYFIQNRFLAFIACCLLSFQFMVWGFGHQGRGYALCYLLGWISFVSYYFYFFGTPQNSKKELGALIVLCNIIGMWVVPTYLFIIAFQVLCTLFLVAKNRKFHFQFWGFLVLSAVGIFFVYLPLFCYSGIQSLVGNNYVSANGVDYAAIWTSTKNIFYDVVSQETFGFMDLMKMLSTLLFLVPFLLFVFFRKSFRHISGLIFMYFVMWLAVAIMIFVLKQFPVLRAIGIQMHLTLCVFMITISIALNKITKAKMLFGSLYTGLIIIASIRMFHYNKEFSNNDLYAQDTRRFLDALNTIPLDFDKNTSIWLTDESFMWPFLLKDFTNVSSHDCNFNNQKILFVSEDDKNLPRGILENYRIKSQASWFTVYELK